jgi:hypothetical protein
MGKRRTDYKVDKIKTFILNNNPTRSEIIRHIVVDINKKVSGEFFDNNHRQYRGYYACNIQMMRNTGNVATDKSGRYYVTLQGLKNENSLYYKPDLLKLKDQIASFRLSLEWSENREGTYIDDIIRLRQENSDLRELITNIKLLSSL